MSARRVLESHVLAHLAISTRGMITRLIDEYRDQVLREAAAKIRTYAPEHKAAADLIDPNVQKVPV